MAAFIYCRTVWLDLGIEADAAGIGIPTSKSATRAFLFHHRYFFSFQDQTEGMPNIRRSGMEQLFVGN
jgi:hypothetical protein